MRIIIGLIFIAVAPLGVIYFRNYTGKIIPYPFLWYTGFILLEILGWLLIYWAVKSRIKKIAKPLIAEVENLKANGEKVVPDFDRCEFKNGSYSHEVDDPRVSNVQWLGSGAIASMDVTTTENIIQSYLVYYHPGSDPPEKFISHHFPFETTTLKYHVLKQEIVLYVDRFDRKKYLFDLKK